MHARVLVVAALCLLGAPVAWAVSPDVEACKSASAPDARIEHCTRAIVTGEMSGVDLATAFVARGDAYLEKGDSRSSDRGAGRLR
jgi:hypothetical protein